MSELEYLAQLYEIRDQYRSNAEQAIAAGEFRKASKLLWGAITQQLKALAATYSVAISSHREFSDFLRQLSAELHDKTVYEDFVSLNALHKNFYDDTIPSDVFPDFYDKSIQFTARLARLARGQ